MEPGLFLKTTRKNEKIIVGIVGTFLLGIFTLYVLNDPTPGWFLNVITPLSVSAITAIMFNIIID